MPKLPEIEQAETLTTLSIIDPKNPALKPLFSPTWEPGPWNFLLRSFRQAADLTLSQLDCAASLRPQAAIQFEAMRAWPDQNRAESIAQVLGVSSTEIFPPWLEVFVRPRSGTNHLEILTDQIGDSATDPADLWISRETALEKLQRIINLPKTIRTVLVLTAAGYPAKEIAKAARIKLGKVREMQGVANHRLIFSL